MIKPPSDVSEEGVVWYRALSSLATNFFPDYYFNYWLTILLLLLKRIGPILLSSYSLAVFLSSACGCISRAQTRTSV